MNHDDATRYFDGLGAGMESRPPVSDLVIAGRNAERRKRRRTMAASAATVAVILGGGATVQQATAGGDGEPAPSEVAEPTPQDDMRLLDPGQVCPPGQSRDDPEETGPVPTGPDYPVNEQGQTYGGMAAGDYPDPDLVAVYGNCGRSGYALREDLEDPAPWVPDAGLDGTPRTVPVYELDGVTQIDTFTIGAAEGSSSGVDSAPPTGPGAEDVQGAWRVTIGGVQRPDGSQQFDTYRDLDLTATVRGNTLRLWDGCVTSTATFELHAGQFDLTARGAAEVPTPDAGCERQAPLAAILDNIRHVTTDGGDVYLHLDTFQIVLVLKR